MVPTELEVLERLTDDEPRRAYYLWSLINFHYFFKHGISDYCSVAGVERVLDDCVMRGYAARRSHHNVHRWILLPAGHERRKTLVREQLVRERGVYVYQTQPNRSSCN